MSHAHSHKRFLPAAGWDFLLPLYDPFTKLLGADRMRRSLVEQAQLRAGHRVLEIGCGTGSLLVLCKQQHPDVDAIGLDPDPKALARARKKAERASMKIRFDHGFADALPYDDASFDRVFSSLMFHHLEAADKAAALAEVARVLKPGGRLELADFAGPHDISRSRLRPWVHGQQRLADNDAENVLGLMRNAGLDQPELLTHTRMLFGTVAYYCARRRG
jgi:ubiquinone/menaquinone biosynthesis C-methylase UbiE